MSKKVKATLVNAVVGDEALASLTTEPVTPVKGFK